MARWSRGLQVRLAPVALLALVACTASAGSGASPGSSGSAAPEGASCACAGEEVLDRECCACTVTQVAQATSAYFKDLLVQLVETPLFRVYTPYPDHPGRELFDVECSISEFQEVAAEISAHQLGCAIQQCGCAETECQAAGWRQKPCFTGCEADAKAQTEQVASLAPTPPLRSDGSGSVQYDLLENPEQFTGYGTLLEDRSARMIWDNLYTDKFCFTSCPNETEAEPQAEKRLVFRLVSGLQASINTHLAMHYGLYSDSGEPATRENWSPTRELTFGPWRELFDERVGRHPDRVRNMHFVFALLTRALQRLAPHLERVLEAGAEACPKCASQHNHTRDLMRRLVEPAANAPEECHTVLHAFDASALFASGDAVQTASLKEELRIRFRRMGELMTCVGCDRCKLWGTLQFHAARVAVGLLLDDADAVADSQYAVPALSQLKPNDIVALVNTLAQVSKSVDQASEWLAQASRAEL